MNKKYSNQTFEKLINEVVGRGSKRRMNEGFDPMDGFGEFSGDLDFGAHDSDTGDDYEDEVLASLDKKNKKDLGINPNDDFMKAAFNLRNGLGKDNNRGNFDDIDDDEAESLIAQGRGMFDFGDIDGEEEEDTVNNNGSDNELFNKALEDLERDNGRTSMKAWVAERVEEGSDQEEAEKTFKAAKEEFNKEQSEYETDTVTSFSGREMKPEEPAHQAGNVIDYDGVEIKDDGRQYIMSASDSNPQITIKGSSLREVENAYDSLWRDAGSMEERARKMGLTVYHNALLWWEHYNQYVRSAGGDEPDLPIIIDLDKIKAKNKPVSSEQPTQGSTTTSQSWLEPFKHDINGKYMMTSYQLSRLTPEQRAEWDRLSKVYPQKYVVYTQAPYSKK